MVYITYHFVHYTPLHSHPPKAWVPIFLIPIIHSQHFQEKEKERREEERRLYPRPIFAEVFRSNLHLLPTFSVPFFVEPSERSGVNSHPQRLRGEGDVLFSKHLGMGTGFMV